jgi:hypothetical protein
METAWLLRYELPDEFEDLMSILRNRVQKALEAQNAMLAAALAGLEDDAPGGRFDDDESAI